MLESYSRVFSTIESPIFSTKILFSPFPHIASGFWEISGDTGNLYLRSNDVVLIVSLSPFIMQKFKGL